MFEDRSEVEEQRNWYLSPFSCGVSMANDKGVVLHSH